MARGIAVEIQRSEAVRDRAINLMFPRTREDAQVLTGRQKMVLNMRFPMSGREVIPGQDQVAGDIGVSVRTVQRDERRISRALFTKS